MNTPAEYLRGELYDRVARNPAYSLRALARDMGVSHTYLSLVINQKKRISAQQAAWMADALGFEETTKDLFISSTLPKDTTRTNKKKVEPFHQLEIDKLRCLSGWQHWAILDMTLLSDFKSDPRWIAKRLGLKPQSVTESVNRLVRLGLLEIKNGRWKKSENFISIPTKRSHGCMRQLHRDLILKALKSLNSGKKKNYDARSISGAMLPVNPARLEEAKKRIASFRKSMIRFLSEGECTELYQLNLQLFPLTRGES